MSVSPATLSQILSGRRIPSLKLAMRIADCLSLSGNERRNFIESVIRSRMIGTRGPEFQNQLKPLSRKEIKEETFKAISDCYHYAILELTFVEDFQSNPAWIAEQLGISQSVAKRAIHRLIRLGLLQSVSGRLSKSVEFITTADKDTTSRGHRAHLTQIFQRGIKAMHAEPVERRSMTSLTVAIDPKKFQQAKMMILTFQRKLRDELSTDPQKEVYPLGVCFYPAHTKARRTTQ